MKLLSKLLNLFKTTECPHCGSKVDLDKIPTSGFPPRQRKYCPECGKVVTWVSEPYPEEEQAKPKISWWDLHL